MKKFICLMLLLGVVGCSKSNNSPDVSNPYYGPPGYGQGYGNYGGNGFGNGSVGYCASQVQGSNSVPYGQPVPGAPMGGQPTGYPNQNMNYSVDYGQNQYPNGQNYVGNCSCSEQVTLDFYNIVLVNCGLVQNGSQLHSPNCRIQYQNFKARFPGIACYYNRYGVYGVLNEAYLDQSINILMQMGF